MLNLLIKARTSFFGSRKPELPAIDVPLTPLKQYATEQGAPLLSLTHILRYALIDHPTERVRELLAAYAVAVDLTASTPPHPEQESKNCPGVSADVEAIVRLCVAAAQFVGAPTDTFDSTDLLAAMARHCPSLLEPLGLSTLKVLYFLSHGVPLPVNIEDDLGLEPSDAPVWIRIENDPYSPMAVVTVILQKLFRLEPKAALQLMYRIHRQGSATVGPYSYAKAREDLIVIRKVARDLRHPLRAMLSSEQGPLPAVPIEEIPPGFAALAFPRPTGKSITRTFALALGGSVLALYISSKLIQLVHLHASEASYTWLLLAILGTAGVDFFWLWIEACLVLYRRFRFHLSRAATLALQVGFIVLLTSAVSPYVQTLAAIYRERQQPPLPSFSVTARGKDTLSFNGGFRFGATRALQAALDRYPNISTVQLEGPGGLALEGLLMSRVIRAHHLQTRVEGSCASACTLAYLGGSRRSLGTGAQLLFHRARFGQQRTGEDSGLANLVLSRYMRQRGVSQTFVERVAATPASSLWQPTMGELLDNGVTNEIRSTSAATTLADYQPLAGVRKELAPYTALVQQTKLPQIVIVPKKGEVAGMTSSRFRGRPYWPRALPYPRDAAGAPMVMLVQLNFAEMPPLPNYPKSGILQFFISSSAGQGHFLGMSSASLDANDPRAQFAALQQPEYFRVIYHPNIEDAKDLLQRIPAPSSGDLPFYDTARLSFALRDSYVSSGDYRFERLFGANEDFLQTALGDDFEPIEAHWSSLQAQTLATMGGYSRTEQGFDPRTAVLDEDWLVLLSIDGSADTDLDVAWEDGGVANWWIERRALERLDFSRVAYYWDSG